MDEAKSSQALQYIRMLWYSWCAASAFLTLYKCTKIPYGHFYRSVTKAGYFKWFAFLEASAVYMMALMLLASAGLCAIYFLSALVLSIAGYELRHGQKKAVSRKIWASYAAQAILNAHAAIGFCLYCTGDGLPLLSAGIPAAISVIIMEIFLAYAICSAAPYWHAFRTGRIVNR